MITKLAFLAVAAIKRRRIKTEPLTQKELVRIAVFRVVADLTGLKIYDIDDETDILSLHLIPAIQMTCTRLKKSVILKPGARIRKVSQLVDLFLSQ